MKAISLKNTPTSKYLYGLDRGRVSELTQAIPTPFMVLRPEAIRANYRRLKAAIPRADIFYAVKANNHTGVLQALRDEGCCFDISSARELAEVLRLGCRPGDTIHTNPIKSPVEFKAAVDMGVETFVVDNMAELEKFPAFGGRAGALLRIKTNSGGSVVDLSYKFGALPQDVPALLDRLIELRVPFRGFCFHVGSQCTRSSKYVAAIKTASRLIALARQKGIDVPVLDIGGGFPIEYTGAVPSIERIGQKISEALATYIDPAIRVICEPGRYICGNAVTLFSSVIGKTTRSGLKWYYIDDGVYGSFSGRLFDHCSYQILTNRNTKWEKAVLAGPTCDSFDVVYNDCLMPPLDIGDILMFPAMGAYCTVSATDFNGLGQTRIIEVDW